MKKYLYFYIIAIIMLVNDALFNLIGMRVGISPWRQIIWLFAIIAMIQLSRKYYLFVPCIRKTIRIYIRLFLIVLIFALYTLLKGEISLIRVLMSIIEYFYGLPFIIFPFVCAQSGWSRDKLDKFFIVLGIFLSAGFIIDYSSGGSITLALSALPSREFDEFQFEYGRYNFLSTSNTLLTVILGISLFCTFNYYKNTGRGNKLLLIVISVFIVFGTIFSGARQTLAGLLIVEVVGLLSIVIESKRGIFSVLFFIVLFFVALPSILGLLSENKGYTDRYTSEAIKEDERSNTWREGFNYCFTNTTLERILVGEGVGYTLTAHASSREKKGKHFENSFFARISDVGVFVGLSTLLMPVLLIFGIRKRSKVSIIYYGLIMMYVFISFVSPNGLGNQTQVALFIILGLCFADSNREHYLFKERK